jgi:hypothetical protein
MAIKTYKRTEKRQLSKNFSLDEFKCKCGKCGTVQLDENLVERLQQIRDHFGKAVTINSGYRCENHNASPQVGGAKGSLHVKGMATDIRVQGILPKEVAKYAESIGVLGIGLYDDFVHIDTRIAKSFWKGHQQTRVDTFGGKPQTVNVELPILRNGSNSPCVKTVQILLNENRKAKISEDGIYGGLTENAVAEYQRKVGLDDDGIVGCDTWSRLIGM